MSFKAAYIVPHPPLAVAEIGKGKEQAISATLEAYHNVAHRIAAHEPDTIIFISPHSAYYADWIYVASGKGSQGSFAEYGAPEVAFNVSFDTEYRSSLVHEAKERSIPAGTVGDMVKSFDHGLMVPLYFIEKEYPLQFLDIVSLGGSGLSSEMLVEFGRCIARNALASEKSYVLVASGDLSHKLSADGPYGFDPAGPLFDDLFAHIIQEGQPLAFGEVDPQLSEGAAECGLSGFTMLAGAVDEVERLGAGRLASTLLSLEGPFGVGYGVASFECETSLLAEEEG